MLNYAIISEAITKKYNEAKLSVDSLETVITEHIQPEMHDLENRYINGENVGEALDEAYEANEKAFEKLEYRRTILKEYETARSLYLEALQHLERANKYKVYGF